MKINELPDIRKPIDQCSRTCTVDELKNNRLSPLSLGYNKQLSLYVKHKQQSNGLPTLEITVIGEGDFTRRRRRLLTAQ
jgi:hypothetical protein